MLLGRVRASLRATLWLLALYGGALLGVALAFLYLRARYLPPPVHRFPVELQAGGGVGVLVGHLDLCASSLLGQPRYLSAYVDARVDARVDANADANADANVDANADANANANTRANANANAHTPHPPHSHNLASLARPYEQQGRATGRSLLRKHQAYDLVLHLQVAELPAVLDHISPLVFDVALHAPVTSTPQPHPHPHPHPHPQPIHRFTALRSLPHPSASLRAVRDWLGVPLGLLSRTPPYSWYQFCLLSNFVDDAPEPILRFSITIQPAHAHAHAPLVLPVNGAVLELTAHFHGLRHVLHRWPVASALLFIGAATFLAWLLITVHLVTLVALHRAQPAAPEPDPSNHADSDQDQDQDLDAPVLLPDHGQVQAFVGHLRQRHLRAHCTEPSDAILLAPDLDDLAILSEAPAPTDGSSSGDQSVPSSHD